MLRLTARNVLLLAAAASLSGSTPVDAQIFGRLPESQAAPNASCGLSECPPGIDWGYYHENWRRWPEDPMTELGEQMLSPFSTPGGIGDAKVPDAKDEDAITPRKRTKAPAFSAPSSGFEANGPGMSGSESIPSPPSSSSSSADSGFDLPDDTGTDGFGDSNSSTDDPFGNDPTDSGDDGLFQNFDPPAGADEPAPQPEAEESDLDDIFGDFGRTTPNRQRPRSHQMRRPSLTQRKLASRTISTQPNQQPTQPVTAPWQTASDQLNTSSPASAPRTIAERRSPSAGKQGKGNPLRAAESFETAEAPPAESTPKVQPQPLNNAMPNPAAAAQAAHVAAVAASQRAYAHQMQMHASFPQQAAQHAAYGYPPYYAGVPMQPTGYPQAGDYPPNQAGGQTSGQAPSFAPEYNQQPTMQTAPINQLGNNGAPAQHQQPAASGQVQPASAIVAIEEVSVGGRRNPLRR